MSEARPSMTPRQVVASLVIAVLFLAAGVLGFGILKAMRGEPDRSPRPVRSVVVRAIEPSFQPYREEISGYGRVRALRRSAVPAEVAAVVESVAPQLEAGRTVDATTVLVRLATADFDTEVKSRTAQLTHDTSALSSARTRHQNLGERVASMSEEVQAGQRDHDATAGLKDQGLATQRELDVQRQQLERLRQRLSELQLQEQEAAEAIRQAEQDVERATQALARARADLDRCEVRSPYSGVVVRRSAQVGTWVTPGRELFEVLDPTRVEVPISLAAQRYGEVEVGAAVRLYSRRGGALLAEAAVARVDPAVGSERSFMVYAELGDASNPATLEPGRFVYALVDGPQYESVVPVPRVAFVGDRVFVAEDGPEGTVARRRTPTVIRWLPEVALVVGGIEEGQPILVSNLEEVAEGTAVRVSAEAPSVTGSVETAGPRGRETSRSAGEDPGASTSESSRAPAREPDAEPVTSDETDP